MKNILIFCFLILFTSCVTQKRCLEKFPPIVEERDSVSTVIVVKTVHDTVSIPGDSVHIYHEINCDSLKKGMHIEKDSQQRGIKAVVDIRNGRLSVICKVDSLVKIIARQDSVINYYRFHSRIEKVVVPEFKRHWYDKIFSLIGVLSVLALGIYITYRLRKV